MVGREGCGRERGVRDLNITLVLAYTIGHLHTGTGRYIQVDRYR